MTRVPLSTRLYNTVKPSTVLPKLPYGMTVGAYIQAVDRLNPGCKIGKHIEEERRCYNMALGGKMGLLVEKAVDASEAQGCDILLDLLVYPFLKQDSETRSKKSKPRKESIEHRKDNQEPQKEGDTDE